MSHPSRVSGLKLSNTQHNNQEVKVSPFAGEWIEILSFAAVNFLALSLTLRG